MIKIYNKIANYPVKVVKHTFDFFEQCWHMLIIKWQLQKQKCHQSIMNNQ